MKKYKHVKTGAVAEGEPASGKPFKVTLQDSGLSSIDEEFLINGGDWELVKDWHVLTYTRIFSAETNEQVDILNQVCRLSDNQSFVLGEEIYSEGHSQGIIRKFKEVAGIMMVSGGPEKDMEFFFPLSEAKKAPKKKPLFKTEDGVDIYEGDTQTIYRLTQWTLLPVVAYVGGQSHLKGETFYADKQKGEEYIFFNKPFLSVKECIDWLGDSMAGTYDSKQKLIARYPVFVHRVESKLKK